MILLILPVVTALVCLCVGRMSLSVKTVIDALTSAVAGKQGDPQSYSIVINLRLPRILMAVVVGAGLTCAGSTFQALFSNPLATPDILV